MTPSAVKTCTLLSKIVSYIRLYNVEIRKKWVKKEFAIFENGYLFWNSQILFMYDRYEPSNKSYLASYSVNTELTENSNSLKIVTEHY